MARRENTTIVDVVADERMPPGIAVLASSTGIVPIVNLAPGITDFVCGLRKVGPSKYSLVTGCVVDGVPDLKVDSVSQSLDHAAEELLAVFRKLMETIP